MRRKYTFIALAAFALAALLPAEASQFWLYESGAKTLTLSDTDPEAVCTPVKVYNVSPVANGSTKLTKASDNTIPFEGCPLGGASFDFTLPIKDGEGIDYALVSIASECFSGNNYIGSVKLPDSFETLGSGAFRSAKYLKAFAFPASPTSLTSVGDSAFYGCSRLEWLEWPATIATIASFMCNSSGITGIYFPAVTEIKGSAFGITTNLRTVEFGGSDGQTIVFKPQCFQGQGTTIKTIFFHEATPDLTEGFVNGGNNFLDHVGWTGLVIYLPMNASKDDVADGWKTWVQDYLAVFTGSSFTFPQKNPDGSWTDGSWYHHANYAPARKTYVIRAWDPAAKTVGALLCY